MRVDGINGLYLQYRDIAAPVECIDRVVYSFPKQKDRTCLVSNPVHIEILLKTGKYRVVGVEIPGVEIPSNNGVSHESAEPVTATEASAKIDAEVKTPKKRGRPAKRRNHA